MTPGTNARRLLAAAVVAAIAVALPSAGAAQPKNQEAAKITARKLLASGDHKLKHGDRLADRGKQDEAIEQYAAALSDYQAAFDAYPHAQIYFPIALAEQKLGRNLDAFRHYTQLLEEVPNLGDDVKKRVQDRLNEVKRRLGAIKFVVHPDAAKIEVNGNEIGTSPLEKPYWLTPGQHNYRISAEGYSTVDGSVELSAGEVDEEDVALEKIPDVVETPEPEITKKPPPIPTGPSRMPLWIGLGATGAFAGAATITGILAVSRHGTFTDETLSAKKRESARSSGKKLALTTDLLLVATAAAGAYTAYYYYKVYQPNREAFEARLRSRAGGQTQSLWVAPFAGRTSGGLAVGGRF